MAAGDRTEARLGGPTQLGTTTTTVCTVAASRVEVLKQIIICIISQLPIGANDIMVFDTALVLTAGETLQGLADAASVVNVTVIGWEKEV